MTQSPQANPSLPTQSKAKPKTQLEHLQDLKRRGINLEGLRFPRHSLAAVKGQDNIVGQFKDQSVILNNPNLKSNYLSMIGESTYTHFYIFEGPTGSGKTYLAEAIAGSIKNAIFINIEAKSIKNSQYVNTTQRNLEMQFDRIRRLGHLGYTIVVLLDEIDSLLTTRSGNTEQATLREDNDVVNRFLSFVDGVADKPRNLIFIGTTNRIEHIDPAAIRPCRFEALHIGYPDKAGVRVIVKHYLTQMFQKCNIIYRQEFEDNITNLFEGQSPVGIKLTIVAAYKKSAQKFILRYARSNPSVPFYTWFMKQEDEFVGDWFMGIMQEKRDLILEK
jgi:SpoVK/Ycf46/Vps4 family AAA+-type ATPase